MLVETYRVFRASYSQDTAYRKARLGAMDCGRYITRPYDKRQKLAELGKKIAVIVNADDDASELAELITAIGIGSRIENALRSLQDKQPSSHACQSLVWCEEEALVALADDCEEIDGNYFTNDYYCDNFSSCNCCDSSTRNDDLTEVQGGDFVCEHCLRREYSRCDDCGEHVEDGNTHSVDGNCVCNSCIDNGDYYFWESDSEYHTTPERESELPGYHEEARPSWWTRPHEKHGCPKSTPCFGVELEVDCSDIPALIENVSGKLLAESDGSLRDETGVELIGGPYTLAQYQSRETPWSDVDLSDCKGHTAHTNGQPYGIHVSVGRASFSGDLHVSKFVVLLNQLERLGKLVAQRAVIYNGKYKVRCKCGQSSLKTDKYEPVNVGSKRLEVRIFRSNTRYERIAKNVEYVAAIQAYSRDVSMLELSSEQSAERGFLKFLQGNSGQYPNLCQFLAEQGIEELQKWNNGRKRNNIKEN